MFEVAAASLAKTGAKRMGFGGVGLAAAGGAAVIGAGPNFVCTIPEGYVGLLKHWGTLRNDRDRYVNFCMPRLDGELYKFGRKGRKLVLPIADKWEVISTQDRNSQLPQFSVVSDKDQMFTIDGQLKWGVVRETDKEGKVIDYGVDYPELVYRALISAQDIEELRDNVVGDSVDVLRTVLNDGKAPSEIPTSELYENFARSSELGQHLLHEYGVEVRGLSLPNRSFHWSERLRHSPPSPGHLGGMAVEGVAPVIELSDQRLA